MQQFATDQQPSSNPLIQSEQLTQMVDDLFNTMLSMPVNSAEKSDELAQNSMNATVVIEGDWCAQLHVFATKKFASLAACAMFGLEPAEISDEEVSDALGEVANVIGGNAKGIVDKDCSLSLPCVGGEGIGEVSANALQLSFECNGEPFHVVLVED